MTIIKKRMQCTLGLMAIAFLLSNCFCSAESDAFQTYTYSSRGEYQISPNTYQVNRVVDSIGEAGNLSRPTDIVVNRNMDVFIADTGNNRIVILDSHLNYKGEIKDLIDEQGEQTSLNAPQGIFISQQGFIYVCDTDNNRIVKLNADLTVDRIIKEPDKSSLPTNFEFKPTALAIDSTGRLNIVCQTTNMGILAMDEDSHFEGYVGAMRVSVNFFQLIKRIFMTEEQIRRSEQYVSSPYNNIQVDSRGFLYVTSSSISSESIQAAIRSNSASSTNAVIRKLTPSGTDVLVRNGHFPPVGAINFKIEHLNPNAGASTISEVAVSPDDQVYILVDSKYNKMFAYDQQGNLLYAFGGYGTVPGKFQQLSSVAFHGDELLALDSENNCITVFEKTAYGILLDKAISLQSQNQYSEAASVWKEVLKQNNNFDLAYVYIGKQLLQSGDYTTAMQYFYNTDMPKLYSQALSYQRAQWAEKWAIPLFIGILFVLIVLIVLFRKIKPKSDYPLKTLYPRAFQTGQNHLIYYDFTTVE